MTILAFLGGRQRQPEEQPAEMAGQPGQSGEPHWQPAEHTQVPEPPGDVHVSAAPFLQAPHDALPPQPPSPQRLVELLLQLGVQVVLQLALRPPVAQHGVRSGHCCPCMQHTPGALLLGHDQQPWTGPCPRTATAEKTASASRARRRSIVFLLKSLKLG